MDAGQRKGSAIARMIWVAGSPILFTLGVVGNLITIIVLTGKHNKMTSTSFFLTILAVADLMVLTLVQPRWWFIYTFGVDIRHLNNATCKVQWFIAYVSGTYSTLTLAAVTVERVISTVRPHKVKTWCSIRIAGCYALILCLVTIGVGGHVFYGFKLFQMETVVKTNTDESVVSRDQQFLCSNMKFDNLTHGADPSNSTLINACFENTMNKTGGLKLTNTTDSEQLSVTPVWSSTGVNDSMLDANETGNEVVIVTQMCWFDDADYGRFYSGPFQIIILFVYVLIPESIFAIGGGIIIWKLFKSARWRHKMTHDHWKDFDFRGQIRNSDNQAVQITRTLLLVNFAFFVCTTPVHVFLIGRPFWVDEEIGMTETQEIVWAIVNQLFFLNHATNFILYFLSGSRFRKMVVKTLCPSNKPRTQHGQLSCVSSYDSFAQQGYFRST